MLSISLMAEGDSSKTFHFLSHREEIDLNPISINPDMPLFKFSRVGGKWENMLGGRFGLFQYGKRNTIGFNAQGFAELHDFTAYQWMSWQLWRGSFGFDVKARIHATNTLLFAPSLAWIHESDHVTDVNGYESKYLYRRFSSPRGPNLYEPSQPYDRSFEYFRFGLETKWKPIEKLELGMILHLKMFPEPIGNHTLYKLKSGYSWEIIATAHLFPILDLYGAMFYEQIANDFNSEETRFINTMVYEPLSSWYTEIGLSLKGEKLNRLNLFGQYRSSYGRGMNFIEYYREWGWGVKFIL